MSTCNCMGPQNGEPFCPCQMRAIRDFEPPDLSSIDVSRVRIRGGLPPLPGEDTAMSMVERVAQAIATQSGGTMVFEPDRYRATARAAIEAMREPSESAEANTVVIRDYWNAMIDAALAQEP